MCSWHRVSPFMVYWWMYMAKVFLSWVRAVSVRVKVALELIKRGHRLVSDDVVEISKVSDVELVGTAPDITRHFIELRGIGIIDVKTLFGVESVKNTQSIDLVIKLEEWSRIKNTTVWD